MASNLDAYVGEAVRLDAERRGRDPAWLAERRADALDRFRALGFPTPRDEEWRFTSVAPIAEGRFALAHNGASSIGRGDVDPFGWAGEPAATLVFVNGRHAEAASTTGRLPAGVRVESLARALTEGWDGLEAHLARAAAGEREAFTSLNTAFLADGALVHVPDSTILEAPVHLVFLAVGEGQPTMAHPRVLVTMGANSQASIVETYGAVGADRYFTNAVTEVVAGERSVLHHYRVQQESPAGLHIGAIHLQAARGAALACHSINLGGALVRNGVNAVLAGEGAGCTLNGLYLADGDRLIDNHTTIDHARPHCGSREVYKGILAGRARAVFNGKIVVRPDAQKTDAKQTSKALLLSEDAQINTKPELEIFADDVKCTHGAAVGQMDDEAVFYLRARGLDAREARHILIRAFAGDVLMHMPLEPLRLRIDEELARRLPGWSL